jgi:hypothetical protein
LKNSRKLKTKKFKLEFFRKYSKLLKVLKNDWQNEKLKKTWKEKKQQAPINPAENQKKNSQNKKNRSSTQCLPQRPRPLGPH